VTCQAGVVTEAVQNFARDHGLYYPVDFASRGSSQIGGNIATNAGGIKVIRYGLTRDWVTGLKVIDRARRSARSQPGPDQERQRLRLAAFVRRQ
jgi:FAD/FMN-containing dehydrogenase